GGGMPRMLLRRAEYLGKARDGLSPPVMLAVSCGQLPGVHCFPFPTGYAQDLVSMPVAERDPMTNRQLEAVAAMLAALSPRVTELGELFAAAGHELALVGGPVRDAFLGRVSTSTDFDLTTDALPDRILDLVADWADQIWTVGIKFGTVGLRKGSTHLEITTYRSDSYDRLSRKPVVSYGQSLTDDLSRRDFTVNAMAARLPGYQLVDPFRGLADLQ